MQRRITLYGGKNVDNVYFCVLVCTTMCTSGVLAMAFPPTETKLLLPANGHSEPCDDCSATVQGGLARKKRHLV